MIPHGSGKIPGKDASLREGAALRTEDPELTQVIDSWYSLPDAVRAGITAMVRAAR